MAELTQEQNRAMNEAIYEKIASDNPLYIKEAADAVTEFTRMVMREDGIYRRVLPMVQVSNDQLQRSLTTDKPVVIVDREPISPAAVSLPFATLPDNHYIKGDRYPVHFDRISTSRFTKDVDELRTWQMDIRQVISDNAIRDMQAEEDAKFLRGTNNALVGAGLTVAGSGVVQWDTIPGGITRDSLYDGFKIMPNCPASLEVKTILMNQITIKDVCKLDGIEMGGGSDSLSAEVFRNGWSQRQIDGRDVIVTIKKALVPTGTFHYFADPAFTGKSFSITDVTMYIRREFYFIEFFAYELIGGALGNTSAVARADYSGV